MLVRDEVRRDVFVDDRVLPGAERLEVASAACRALALLLRHRVNRRLRLQLRLPRGGAGPTCALRLFVVARRALLELVRNARHLLGLRAEHLALELRHVVLQGRQRVGQALVLGDELCVGARESGVLDGERLVALLPLAVVFSSRHLAAEIKLSGVCRSPGSHFFERRT